MLKTNIKLWIVVIMCCLFFQFFIKAVPQWIENGKQEAQTQITQMEQEKDQNNTEHGK